MKKIFCSLALSVCLMLTGLAFCGCNLGGYSVNTNDLIGVWEVSDEGGYSYITRIEFKKSPAGTEGQGPYTYYVENGTTTYNGHWSKRESDKEFDLIPESGGVYEYTQIATLAEGKLYIQFNNETTITYRKIRD